MAEKFTSTFDYKLIYVFEIPDEAHKGLVKIGDATLHTDKQPDQLSPNCAELNTAARDRINSYTRTAGIKYNLLYTELATRMEKNKDATYSLKYFRDKVVHAVLRNSGFKNIKVNDTTGTEWFEADLNTVKVAIQAVKDCRKTINASDTGIGHSPIIFRPEQAEAIKMTVKQFKQSNKMLWNAKMRFGKTLSALQVVKEMEFKKTVIVTHRPVVNAGWYEDFNNIFFDKPEYTYGSKSQDTTIADLEKTGKNYVYFASVQDLRGSKLVGGKFEKNDDLFDIEWDFVINDEAHEGTKTELGEAVIAELTKSDKTKFLALSGTPFNIMDEYEDSIYTWDYVMEQKAKKEWDEKHFGDANPYEELPELKIFTYDLGKILGTSKYQEIEDKAFNFKEFFRTWTGDVKYDGTKYKMPETAQVGDFVHEQDIMNFLDLIAKTDKESNYPYSNEEYRNLFKHTLWMIPGVREAKALKALMLKHKVFGCGQFNIVNVAGDGDEENKDALISVKTAIREANLSEIAPYTITLSCGKLTTGVSVPEWTAVMMLAGSYSTSAANYLQTIFRVQTPCNIDGKIKTSCYVFDFAPDRTLKMVADAVKISAKPGKGSGEDRRVLGEFLNYCSVISLDGTQMHKYNVDHLLQQLKHAYADRAVRNGFDDTNLYNDELLNLDKAAWEEFEKLHEILKESKSNTETSDIKLNGQGFDEESREIKDKAKKEKRELTPEEQARLDELKKQKEQRRTAISNLRAISIRIPLLIYGADVPFDNDITIQDLPDLVDESSWKEFMPNGITKDFFKQFIKYYDGDVFIAAGRKIRNTVKGADELPPTERIKKISELFSHFKNPDKETVLTPWRVVNMHLGDCIGGWNFWDEDYLNTLEKPRYVEKEGITSKIFKKTDVRILEINSKTGLYPLYATYSVFRNLCEDFENTDTDAQNKLWEVSVKNNIFVICKTEMAKKITKRTLVGYRDIKVNAHYFDDLINMMKNKSDLFITKVTSLSYWKLEGNNKMTFDAIIGNPPYQEMDGGNGASASPIYNYFVNSAKRMNPKCISMIMPSRWFAGGKGLDDFRASMLNDRKISYIKDFVNAKDCFPTASIGGGVCYFLRNNDYEGDCTITNILNGKESTLTRPLNEFDIFIRYNEAINMIHKIAAHNESKLSDLMLSRNPFGLPSSARGAKDAYDNCLILNSSKGISYINRTEVTENKDYIDKYKVMISKVTVEHAGEPDKNGQLRIISSNKVLEPKEVCTDSYLILGKFDTKEEAENLVSYIKTRFARYLLLQAVTSINLSKDKFQFVPVQDFSKKWTDKDLYKKYELLPEEIECIESMIKEM